MIKSIHSSIRAGLVAFAYSLCTLSSAWADDTEVFFGGTSSRVVSKPNVLFVIDTSGSMGTKDDGVQSRISIVQEVMTDFLSTQASLNMGLARFHDQYGGPIMYPVVDPDLLENPYLLQGLASANDDAIQTGVKVTLNDDYLDPVISMGQDGIIALRFQNVGVPQGANIAKAILLLSSSTDSNNGATYEIYAEKVPDAAAFSATDNNLSGRSKTASSVNWVVGSWDADAASTTPTSFESADFSTVMQEVVNQKGADINDPAGWCGGNSMVIFLKKIGADGRAIVSHDLDDNFFPKLRVDFEAEIPAGQFGCYATTVYDQITHRDRDSEYSYQNSYDSRGSVLSLYKYSGSKYNKSVGLGFVDIKVPKNASISDARLTLRSYNSQSNTAKANIHLINSANPPTSGKSVHTSSSLSSAVAWDIGAWTSDKDYSSPNLASIVQALVNRSDWTDTSNMTFLIKGSSGNRDAYSYDGGGAGRAAKLQVTYRSKYEASSSTKRQAMLATVQDLLASGWTPISDNLAEAGAYYLGDDVHYGLQRGIPAKSTNRISHIDSTVAGSIYTPPGCTDSNPGSSYCTGERYTNAPDYNSPIEDACQPNHIVFLTDGEPTRHHSDTNALYAKWHLALTGKAGSCKTNDTGKDCTIKIASLLHENDVKPSSLDVETVTTHTVGFFTNQSFLQSVASAGGGKYITASSKEALKTALNEIANAILDVSTTFVSAGVAVNQYNRLTHSDEMYFSLFKPTDDMVWPGNLKRYKLSGGQIVDVNGDSAVSSNGQFEKTAQSWWTASADGNNVPEGGAAGQMTNNRKVFSDITGSYPVALNTTANILSENNGGVTNSMVLAVDEAERKKILRWVTGQDVNDMVDPTQARKQMGDPLHSQPVLLSYKTGSTTDANGNSIPVFNTAVFVGTNEGFLHSFDTATGKENWSFIPKELMTKLKDIYSDASVPHTYGLDGSITVYVEDKAGGVPGMVDPGEKAYLYVGMRRGGNTYYAFDVSDLNNPKLQFKIDPNTSGYSDLGETWSKPVVKKFNIFTGYDSNNENEAVLVFGGGYSRVQDTAGTDSQTDDMGKNVYIADAISGKLLWNMADAVDAKSVSGSKAESKTLINGVPNSITAFDLSGDEFVDHFYATDTKGQIFRFDVDEDKKEITAGRIAHLQGEGGAANNRRFYNYPDASVVQLDTGSFVAVSVGSGYRAHPLDATVTDHFYMVKDEGVLKGVFDMDAAIDNLVDVTDKIGDSDSTPDGVSDAREIIYDKDDPTNGWYIHFSLVGEKVLSGSITFNSVVYFTTYTPSVEGGSCKAEGGTSRFYALSLIDGNPLLREGDDNLTNADRYEELKTGTIASDPTIFLQDNGEAVACVANECFEEKNSPKGVRGATWNQMQEGH